MNKVEDKSREEKVFLELKGNANDLLMVNGDNSMKCTRLLWLNPKSYNPEDEVVDLCITSTNLSGEHPLFDKILGKKIKITVTIED